MNDDDLVKLEQNAFRDSMKDGITEFLAGFIFLFLTISFVMPSVVSIFVVFYILFLPKLIEHFREKYTYPRIGYVKLKTKESDFSIGAFIVLLILVVSLTGITTQIILGDMFNLYNWLLFIPFAFGLLMFGPSVFLVEKTGSRIYWLFGIITTILGFAISYYFVINPTAEYLDAMRVFGLILGGALVIFGLFKLAYFLLTYPVLDNPEDVVSEQ